MALHVMNVLNRIGVFRGQHFNGPVWVQSAFMAKRPRKPKQAEEDLPESIDAPFYVDELPEIVLQSRERHLPERGQEAPFNDKRRKCVLCTYNIEPDYKNVRLLSQFVSGFSGVIYDRHITGLCQKRHQQVYNEIQKSRFAGLMPYSFKVSKYQNDPQLFNPTRPVRPHPYF